MHVQHDQRQDHLAHVDLIDRAQAGHKVRGRVDVRAPLPDEAVALRAKAGAGMGEQRVAALVWKSLPVRDARRERVGQIDEALTFQDRVGVRERAARPDDIVDGLPLLILEIRPGMHNQILPSFNNRRRGNRRDQPAPQSW